MDDKEKWINEVFDSIKDSERATPPPDLFVRIEKQIDVPEAAVIPLQRWRLAIAAAVLLLLINALALRTFTQDHVLNVAETAASDAYSQVLISSYKIYE
ncbi:MAG: hypothetical protein R2824_10750 [Saprospiraceae bacterium]|nr:hypothetical protein [Lewinella sp.]